MVHTSSSKPYKICKVYINYRPQEHSPRGWKLCFDKVKLLRAHTGELLKKIVEKDERIRELEETIAAKDRRIQDLENEAVLPRCTACFDRAAVRVLAGCGHRVLCNEVECVQRFWMFNNGKCPICQKPREHRPHDLTHRVYD